MAEDCERTLLRRELIRELFEEGCSISELSERYGLFALPAERENLLKVTTACDRQSRAEKKDTLGLR